MIKNVLSEIGGVGLYGVISISLFFLVFTAALVRVFLMKKTCINELSVLPLEDGTAATTPAGAQFTRKGEATHE